MHRIFGYSSGAAKPTPAPAPSLDEASSNIDKRIAYLEGQIKKLEADVLRYKDQMAKMRPGAAQNAVKKRALQALKQKKMYESQLDNLVQQQSTIQQTQFTANSLRDTAVQVEALRSAKVALEGQFKGINIDSVADLQDDLQDLFDTNNEIQDVLSRQYDMPEGMDEDELEAELLNMESSIIEDEADDVPSYLLQARVPTHIPGSKADPNYASTIPSNVPLSDR